MEATIGGTRRHLNQLAHGLPADRYEITVVASAERDATFRADLQSMRERGVTAIELPMIRSIQWKTDSGHIRELRRIIREGKFDIVHSHSSKAGALARVASIREGVGRRVHTPHTFGFAFAGGFPLAKRAVFYGIECALGRMTHKLICVSPAEQAQARRLHVAPARRLTTVANGIDMKPFDALPDRAAARRALGLPAEGVVGIIVALINPAKGHLETAEALASIPPESRPRILCIGGVSEPSYASAVTDRVRKWKIGDSMQFCGHQSNVPLWLAASDFLLCPSRWEGMPYAVLEAMAAGRAVVATKTNGSCDAVVDGVTGWLVPVGDTAAIATRLTSLALDPGPCDPFGAAGRKRALQYYSLETMIQNTMHVYDEVLAS